MYRQLDTGLSTRGRNTTEKVVLPFGGMLLSCKKKEKYYLDEEVYYIWMEDSIARLYNVRV